MIVLNVNMGFNLFVSCIVCLLKHFWIARVIRRGIQEKVWQCWKRRHVLSSTWRQHRSNGWEDATIAISAAAANDASPAGFTDEPRARAPPACRAHPSEAAPSPPALITRPHFTPGADRRQAPGGDRTQGFMFTEQKLREVSRASRSNFSLLHARC